MADFPKKLELKLNKRATENALRSLPDDSRLVDFSSNDYLGFARDKRLFKRASDILFEKSTSLNGATGSRLLTGNHQLYGVFEKMLVEFHETEAALVFNSGYDANIGFFSTVPQRGDVVFYDEFIHASIRDGIALGKAKSYKFKHNDLMDLKFKCLAERDRNPIDTEIYIVTESVFSMDGDSPDLKALAHLSKEHGYHLIIDEAHALGVFGESGEGLIQQSGLQNQVFARIVTFGKAIGCHGAAILGSLELKNYLVNFARSFIYTTALPPQVVATIISAYHGMVKQKKDCTEVAFGNDNRERLKENILFFGGELDRLNLKHFFIPSRSAIQCCLIPGNEKVRGIANTLFKHGYDVKPIMSPTVPSGQERIRFCLHGFNTKDEISAVLQLLGKNLIELTNDNKIAH